MPSPLGDLQRACLQVLARSDSGVPGAPLANSVRDHIHATYGAYWWPSNEGIAACLRRLAKRGLAELLDRSDGARCWTLTDAGRAAVAGGDDPEPPSPADPEAMETTCG